MFTRLFIYLGWSRDDWKLWWAQIITVAALIASNVFDVSYWYTYLTGAVLPALVLHWILGLAAFVLWISARHSSTTLPSAAEMAAGTVPGSPAQK